MKTIFSAALLTATALGATPAWGQDNTLAAEVAAMRAKIESLEAKVKELESGAAKSAAAVPSWKGAPQFENKEAGFTFKPKGFLQFDAGYVGTPGPERSGTVGGLNYNNLGWNARGRRFVFGAEGTLPGGFGYKAEFNFAQGQVDYEDLVLTYQPPKTPLQITIGNFYPLSSLETMTSSRLTSFLERASITDAFSYNRRLGVAVGLVDPADQYTLSAGLWSQEINNASFSRTGWQASVRGTYSPTMGSTRLHLGANFQHRVAQRDAQNVQYRSRPFTQVTDQRFVDTGAIAADGDDIAGIELGAIAKSFHFAGEAQKIWVRGYRPGETFGPNNGAGGGLFYARDPSFIGGYAEIGYYLTGETRGYKGGRWDRTKVLKPFDKGGWGALQANLRVDYLDLRDRVGSGVSLAAPNYINGGQQLGYQASLIWNPMDYLRFQAQYSHGGYAGGPRAATVNPTSTEPVDERDFDVDSLAVRAQVEF
jgi:phosphate-selective porin OprO/OprP